MNDHLRVIAMVSTPTDPVLPRPLPGGDPTVAGDPGDLLARIRQLETRVAALEAGMVAGVVAPLPVVAAPAPPAAPEPAPIAGGTALGLAGRTFLIMGGAFLIRALTDSGALPSAAGVALGLCYAAFWAWNAHRSGLKGRRPWAAFQVFAAAAIAYPLLWETTVRLKAMPPALTSPLMLLATVLFLGVAIRHELRRVAWITALGALATALGVMAATSAIVPFGYFFLLASGAALLLSDREPWRDLRWPAALAVDLAVASMALLALSPGGSEVLASDLQPGRVLGLAWAFLALHLGVFLFRVLRRARTVGGFEFFQTLATLVVGLGCAVLVGRASGVGLGALGAVAFLAGLWCYAMAFFIVEKRPDSGLDFTYLTSAAFVLALAGSLVVMDRQALALVCLVSGGAATLAGVKYAKPILHFHAALLLTVAGVASGLVEGSGRAFLAPVPPGLGDYSLAAFLTFAALVAAHLYPLDRRGFPDLPWTRRLPSLAFAALGVFALGGLLASGLGAFLKEPGPLAALRTCILVALALGTALAGRWKKASELVWLPYPILGCAAVKLLLEDLPKGKPATMFVAFTLFGAGLLLVPKLLGRQAEE